VGGGRNPYGKQKKTTEYDKRKKEKGGGLKTIKVRVEKKLTRGGGKKGEKTKKTTKRSVGHGKKKKTYGRTRTVTGSVSKKTEGGGHGDNEWLGENGGVGIPSGDLLVNSLPRRKGCTATKEG